jgi:hypothetical protein
MQDEVGTTYVLDERSRQAPPTARQMRIRDDNDSRANSLFGKRLEPRIGDECGAAG